MVQFPLANKTTTKSGASARKLWVRLDFIVIAALLFAALIAYLVYNAGHTKATGLFCEISVEGEIRAVYPLDTDRIFSIEVMPDIEFEIRDNTVAFIKSSCPDKVCVHAGYLSHAPQTAICLPNRTSLRVIAPDSADSPDIII